MDFYVLTFIVPITRTSISFVPSPWAATPFTFGIITIIKWFIAIKSV